MSKFGAYCLTRYLADRSGTAIAINVGDLTVDLRMFTVSGASPNPDDPTPSAALA
jgi:hypothetical protein